MRQNEHARAPGFDRILARSRHRSSVGWSPRVGAGAALAVVVALVLLGTMAPGPAAPIPLTTWRPPTDFLLQTPGRDLLATTPAFISTSPPGSARP